MKKSLLVLSVLLLVGCSTTPPAPKVAVVQNPLEAKPDVKTQEAKFLESYGYVKLEFDEKGEEWLTLESTGAAPLNFNQANSREEAFMVANMRAQRNIVEFLSASVKSDKVTETISKVILNDSVETSSKETKQPTESLDMFGDKVNGTGSQATSENEENRQRANKVAQTVKESINQSANGIVKGTMIVNRKIDTESNMVAVTIRVSKKSINAARKIRNQMDGV